MKKLLSIVVMMIVFSNVYSNTFYIDPVNGSNSGDGTLASPWKTLEEVINANLIESKSYVPPYDSNNPQLVIKNEGAPIKAGDTLMLYSGLHGDIFLKNYINDQNITVMNVPEHTPIFKRLHLQAGKNWVFSGIKISSEPYGEYINGKLVFLESHNWRGPVSNIKIENCHVYSTTEPWTTAEDWVNKVSSGIYTSRGTNMIEVNNNVVENIRFGIGISGDYENISGNIIKNFSGDGIRIIGSNSVVEKNIIKNCYDVDNNHDDGIQSFTTGGYIADNNIIRQNIILNYEDPNQPLLGRLQGIGCFDGPYNNWIVENNLVVVDHWHGISLYSAINCSVINNTVLDPEPSSDVGPSWIAVRDEGDLLSSDCTVKNNVANTISVTENTTVSNNTELQMLTDYSANFVDYSTFDFHLLETSQLIDSADNTIAPNIDLDGNERPSGSLPDIGAYEYIHPSSTEDFSSMEYKIFPNPFVDYIKISGNNTNKVNVNIFDANGKLIKDFSHVNLPAKLKMNSLKDGVYFINISDKHNKSQKTRILIKKSN